MEYSKSTLESRCCTLKTYRTYWLGLCTATDRRGYGTRLSPGGQCWDDFGLPRQQKHELKGQFLGVAPAPVLVWTPTRCVKEHFHCMLDKFLLINAFCCFFTLIPDCVWGLGWGLSGVLLAHLQCVRRDGVMVSEVQEVHVVNGSGALTHPTFTAALAENLAVSHYSCSLGMLRELPAARLQACSCLLPSYLSLASSLCSGKEVGSAIWEAHTTGQSNGCTTSPSVGA